MDEVLSHLGHVVVDYVGHVVNVQATRGYISRHQNAVPTLSKAAQSSVALRLAAIAMNAGRLPTRVRELLRYPLRAMLGADEDEKAAVFGTKQMLQERQLRSAATSKVCSFTFSAGFSTEPISILTGLLR